MTDFKNTDIAVYITNSSDESEAVKLIENKLTELKEQKPDKETK